MWRNWAGCQSPPPLPPRLITNLENQICRIYALSYSHSFDFCAASFKAPSFLKQTIIFPKSFEIAKLHYLNYAKLCYLNYAKYLWFMRYYFQVISIFVLQLLKDFAPRGKCLKRCNAKIKTIVCEYQSA